jgi:NAD-dependent deacetylase
MTGAGVSRESGIHTFREKGGVWEKVDAEKMASLPGFLSDPGKVWAWYMDRYKSVTEAEPNPGHYAIAELEKKAPSFTLITQNIDGLHQEAGSVNVLELHGSIRRTRCLDEGTVFNSWPEPGSELPPRCECGSLIRPDVVWFGEALPQKVLQDSFVKARECDLMIVVGTSAVVQPAGLLPLEARQSGALVIEVNPESTAISNFVDISILEQSGSALPQLVEAAFE